MKIFLSNDIPNKAIVYYTLQLIAFNKKARFFYVRSRAEADVTVGIANENDVRLSELFFSLLAARTTHHSKHLNDKGLVIISDNNAIDYLSSIFYYVNCIQEYFNGNVDQYGRFSYKDSIQYKLGSTEKNFVQQLIDEFCAACPFLSHLSNVERASSIFLTHDIDYVFKAKNEDGMFALKNKRWLDIIKLLFNHYLGKPDWLNIDSIVELEQQYGVSSTFFWLAVKNEWNSDYNFNSSLIQHQLQMVKTSGSVNGIHKAIGNHTFDEELKLFTDEIIANRYHFLKFKVEELVALEAAGIKIDSSLGYTEAIGFRNSYGHPFMPFDLINNRVLNVVEVPMQIMDRTLFNTFLPLNKQREMLSNWLEQNKYNSLITVNWHNNFFTDLTYKGYKELYREILDFSAQHNMKCYLPNDIVQEYFKPDFFTIPADLMQTI